MWENGAGRGSQPLPGMLPPPNPNPAGPKAKGAAAAMPCPIIWNIRAIMSAVSGSAALAVHWSCHRSR